MQKKRFSIDNLLLWLPCICLCHHHFAMANDPATSHHENPQQQDNHDEDPVYGIQGMKFKEGSYIVQFNVDVDNVIGMDIAQDMLESVLDDTNDDTTKVEYKFQHLFVGVSLTNASIATIDALRADTFLVQSVVPDAYLELDTFTQQHPLNWGLDRIDSRDLPMNGMYQYRLSGVGTEIYILDTGLYEDHVEFSNGNDGQQQIQRIVACAFDAFLPEGSCQDTIGHGTYVAGIAAGENYGVAKKANVLAVKIYDDRMGGSISTALAGLDYVLHQKKTRPQQPMVINFSLSAKRSDLLNHAVQTLVDAGVVVVVSAGNRASDSCQYSPASAIGAAIVVSAVDYQDAKATYANAGECVTVYAPGHQIPSAWIRDRNDKAFLSGTSAAAAHMTGGTGWYC
jgi:serine protease